MSQAFTVSPVDEVIEFFASGPSREEIAAFRLSDAAQTHIHTLLGKNSAGTLTDAEERELDKMVLLDDIISLIRVRVRRSQMPPQSAAHAPNV